MKTRRPPSGWTDLENSTLGETGEITSFLKRVRQRRLLLLVLDQASIAAIAGLLGAMMVLVTGTQILDWYWPVLLFGGSFLFGLMRMRNRVPSLYQVAQDVDRRLELHDALSTAWHFSEETKSHVKPDVVEAQRQMARQMAASLDPARAVPFRTPQSTYYCAAGIMAAALLFGVRYGFTNSLSLTKPIADIRWNPVAPVAAKEKLASRKSVIQERLEQQLAEMGMSLEKVDSPPGDMQEVTDKAMPAFTTPDGKAPMSAQDKAGEGGEKSGAEMGDNEKGEQAQGDSQQGTDQQSGSEGQTPNMGKAQQAQGQQGKQGQQGAQGDNSLGSKLRDALNQLLAKMKPSSSEGQQASNQQGQQGQKQQAKNQGQAQNQQGQKQGEGQSGKEGQSSKEGEGGEQSQSAQNSRPGERSSDRPGQEDAKSGVGKQDGAKEIREAEQLAAMGKISELIGKRSQQLTGEMTVEVSSGNQQIRTNYSQRTSQHADLGGEIARDEIPLQYQPYIQRYFEEVRKLKR
jgi:hypothetical protein